MSVDEAIKELVESKEYNWFLVNNLRVYIDGLAVSIEDLASHGIMKPEELRGLSGDDTINYAL